MFSEQKEVVNGVKTFFIAPDRALFPEEYLRSFFLKGFETYFVDDDGVIPLESKIRVLFALFPEVILFFNIDHPVKGLDWPVFIAGLQDTYKERAMIGVIYRHRADPAEVRELERMYLYNIGLVCGCIPIENQKAKNLFILTNVLIANQANGRRKYLRAQCGSDCTLDFTQDNQKYTGVLRDVSISHFSCVFSGAVPALPVFEKVRNINLCLDGHCCTVTGVFWLHRVITEERLHVFVFSSSEEGQGCQPAYLIKVNDFVFEALQSGILTLLKKGFETERLCRMIRKIDPDEMATLIPAESV